jgi:hypothetical protein
LLPGTVGLATAAQRLERRHELALLALRHDAAISW